MFYLTMHSTHFYLRLYSVGYMVKDHSDSKRGNLLPPHGLTFRLAARVLLYAPSHRQDSTYHGLCYTSRGALAGTRNSLMGPPWRVNSMINRTMSKRSYHRATSRTLFSFKEMLLSFLLLCFVLDTWKHFDNLAYKVIIFSCLGCHCLYCYLLLTTLKNKSTKTIHN